MTDDYKNTLNLPHTEFAMRANLPQREPEILARWQQLDIYQQLRQHCQGRPKFILVDGPPYANGQIHIGHAVNKILKDIIIKAKTLSGFDAPYVPGWDCHGLPIELNVEKAVGKAGDKVTTEAFRQACRDYAHEQVTLQSQAFQRLGIIGDWERPYLTMQPQFEAQILRALAKIIANGHLEQGHKPVYWCFNCASALAEAEVEYQNKTSPALDVAFTVIDQADFWQRCGLTVDPDLTVAKVMIPIWTTTPWTLPANEAVAIHPEATYCLIQYRQSTAANSYSQLLLAESLLTATLNRYGITDYQVLTTCQGTALQGLLLQHPFYAKQVPVILGEHVTVDVGTGAVHTAPAHGEDDYLVGQQYGLPVNNLMDGHGRFFAGVPVVGGETIYQANKHLIELLRENDTLLQFSELQHSYPHCWRHKTPLVFRATPQWFISMDNHQLREQALAAIAQVDWQPNWGQARIHGMIAQRPDWCVSRQRSWCMPMALIVHRQQGHIHPQMPALLEKIADQVAVAGLEAWYRLSLEELLGAEAADYEKSIHALDVWFDSGVAHTAVLAQHEELQFPADLYLEGSDQHRGWFQSSLLTAVAMTSQAPYRAVITHGFTVDAQGRKMSKSLGNIIAPQKVVDSLGADILRLWVAATDYRAEMNVSDEILKRVADAYRRIRNTMRFLLANLAGFEPSRDLLPTQQLLALDRWIIDRARLLQADIVTAYEQYQFHLIYQKVHNFCSLDLGSFYLDIIKDRQYTTPATSIARRSAQTALYYLALGLVHWLAPILTFTAEEVWTYLPGQTQASVLFSTWPDFLITLAAADSLDSAYWESIMQIRNAVNKELERLRNEGIIGSGLEAEVTLYAEGDLAQHLLQLGDELRFVLITSTAQVVPIAQAPQGLVVSEIPGLIIAVNASPHPKCQRCWHRRADVGQVTAHPLLCQRCVSNITGAGEERHYA